MEVMMCGGGSTVPSVVSVGIVVVFVSGTASTSMERNG